MRFAEDGYAVLERFLDAAVVAAVRRQVAVALEAPPVASCERPHNRLVPLRWNDPCVDLILGEPRRRRAVAAATGGDDLRWISGYISVKDARTPALGWHQDWWCWDHPVTLRPAAAQVALLCYLGDTGASNGALRLLPGSHRAGLPLHAALAAADGATDELPLDHEAFRDQERQVTVSVRAGDAVVLDYRLLHGTHPNWSAARRDCVLLSFTPSWRGLPADVQAHLIQHLAQPSAEERPAPGSWAAELLPNYDGARADLALNRLAPPGFAVR